MVHTVQVVLRDDRSHTRPLADDERAALNALLIGSEK
jgi:hypothetical protein